MNETSSMSSFSIRFAGFFVCSLLIMDSSFRGVLGPRSFDRMPSRRSSSLTTYSRSTESDGSVLVISAFSKLKSSSDAIDA